MRWDHKDISLWLRVIGHKRDTPFKGPLQHHERDSAFTIMREQGTRDVVKEQARAIQETREKLRSQAGSIISISHYRNGIQESSQ